MNTIREWVATLPDLPWPVAAMFLAVLFTWAASPTKKRHKDQEDPVELGRIRKSK